MQLPLHLIISEQLREKITNGELQPGEQLPSEHQLMSVFEVSRITVRRAIANLVNQGLVSSHRGKGVFVKEQRKVTYTLSSPMVFFEEDMLRQGVNSSIQNLVFEAVDAPVEVRQKLQLLPHQTTVYLQKKLLLINDIPVAVDITYILKDLGEKYADDLQRQMTFPTLEQHGVPVERVDAILECTRANYETSEYLDVPLGDPLLVYCHTAYSSGNRPIVCGEALSRGDRLCYSIELFKQSTI
ncbi:GntR family transcriptional regulator [Oscillatoria sp. FACHB-1407]|uniref:GntR family transcriptional regulator n=1 Tax=Oscillatoria sp. FACHB-1407 TaxID=2692847 RepID=UPI0016823518|nr:GntR family transcriptional regulator [Oscillatoria sp. FACHB-1407]MBD2465068.1 GntR family transcriptional regulator [Oscillatoria sp. FACHB-1407]